MSYESITSSVFTNLRSRLRDLPSRLASPVRRAFSRRTSEQETTAEPSVPSAARERATAEIEAFTRQNATLLERLNRWSERAKRLREEGIPSESAVNRASRARRELLDSMTGVREELISEYGEDGERAFDAEIRHRHPCLFED